MLAMLAERGECSAGQLGQPFAISQPTASQHLRVLEGARLVSRRVEGRVHWFRLDPKPFEEAQNWLDRHQKLWSRSLRRLDAIVTEIQTKRGIK
jgi:DNA-binding transcriptional ArsR family regulator